MRTRIDFSSSASLDRDAIIARLNEISERTVEVVAKFENADSQRGNQMAMHALSALLNNVSRLLAASYARQTNGTIGDLELEFWLPALETVRDHLRLTIQQVRKIQEARLYVAIDRLRSSATRLGH